MFFAELGGVDSILVYLKLDIVGISPWSTSRTSLNPPILMVGGEPPCLIMWRRARDDVRLFRQIDVDKAMWCLININGYKTFQTINSWWFGRCSYFSNWERTIIPTDELTPSFFRGLGQPPTWQAGKSPNRNSWSFEVFCFREINDGRVVPLFRKG